MSELKVKSPKAASKKLSAVRLLNDVVFFGINGSQLSATMPGLHLEWDSGIGAVVVTHDEFPGEERWVLAAMIGTMTWKDQ